MLIDKPYKKFLEIVETFPVINEKPDIEDVKKFRKATCNGMMDSKAILQHFETLEDALSTYKKMGGIVYKDFKKKSTKEEKEL